MLKTYRYQIVLIIAIIIGAIIVQSLLRSYNDAIKSEFDNELSKFHSDAVLRAKAGIDVYATLVSSIRAHLKNSAEFPNGEEVQIYLNDLLKDLNFNDSIVVNYVDANHDFKYVVTPTQLDAAGLVGLNAMDIRPSSEIKELNELMQSDEIRLFIPINLREGWAGFPFNFSAKNSKNEVVGYIAPILNVKYLLDYFYKGINDDRFVHRFVINDSIDITREVIYDDTKIFNLQRDKAYYKNFDVAKENFIHSNLDVFGLDLKVGSAFKQAPINTSIFSVATYFWYGLLSIFSFIALLQFVRNKKLNKHLKIANEAIGLKNEALEFNLVKIKTLIKEIHHRVKNNMQMIANLLTLQEGEYDDPKILAALEQSKNRIQSMSLVHEKLYGSSNLQDVNTQDYIDQLISFIEDTVSNSAILPKKIIDISDSIIFDSETMSSLGLILNELITNSYKYAFKPNENNILEISISSRNDSYHLVYSDNGPGLPDDFDIENSESLGMQLVYILTDQLKGHINYTNSGKSTFQIEFKKAEPVH